MIEIDYEERGHLVVVVDGGHRTVLSLPHEDGVDLLRQLTEYYGRLEFGRSEETPRKEGLIQRLIRRFRPYEQQPQR